MSLAGIYNDTIEIYRYSSILYSGDIEEVEISINPAEKALVRVTLNGPQTGSLYLNGSVTETIKFEDSVFAESISLFTSLSGATPSGLTGEMTIEAYDEVGEPVRNMGLIGEAIAYFAPRDNCQYLQITGMSNQFKAMLFVGVDVDIMTGDVVKVDGEDDEFTVHECVTVHGLGSESHKEIILI